MISYPKRIGKIDLENTFEQKKTRVRIKCPVTAWQSNSRRLFELLGFVFPIADHVILLQRTVCFNCRPMNLHPRAFACRANEKTKGKFS